MDSKDIICEKEIEKLNIIKSENKFIIIKSDYFIQKLFNNIPKKITLKIIKNNMNIQKRLNININNYKDFSEKFSSIELEIIPNKIKYSSFIDIKEENKKYFHIYFNDNKKETKRTKINKEDKVSKITIIIDYQVESFYRLFYYCISIESINFKQFCRNNIINMSCMFYGCSSLKGINLSNFNTNNVNDMSYMFCGCSTLKEINLTNFNTYNVTNMNFMFYKCSSLKELILFNTNNETSMNFMFDRCSDELKLKIQSQYKNFKETAFEDKDIDF